MRFNPTPTNGRTAHGDTPFGAYSIEWDSAGNLVGESIEIRDPADAPPPNRAKPTTMAEKAKGAAALLRAERGKQPASDDAVVMRTATCEDCSRNDLGRCMSASGCNCYLWAKVRLANEKCPDGKWFAEERVGD